MKTLNGGELCQTVILDETSENQELVIEQLAIRAAKELPAKNGFLKLEVSSIYANANPMRMSQTSRIKFSMNSRRKETIFCLLMN